MSIKTSQAILKCFIDLKSSIWFTLGSEDETVFCDTWNFFHLDCSLDCRSRFSKHSMTGSPIFSVNFKNLKSSAVLNYHKSWSWSNQPVLWDFYIVIMLSLDVRYYSQLPVTRTPSITRTSRLITRSNFPFPSDHFAYNFILDNSNFFLFPLKVQIIGSRLYFLSKAWHDWRRLTS